MAYVYFLKADSDPLLFKIGYTTASVKDRMQSLQVGCPYLLEYYAQIECFSAHMEKEIHERLDAHRTQGEWFEVTQEIIDEILLDYGVNINHNFDEVIMSNGIRCLVRLEDDAIFFPLSRLSKMQQAAYISTGDCLHFKNDESFVNLGEIEKDYPELKDRIERFRKEVSHLNGRSICPKCGSGKISVCSRGDISAMIECTDCGRIWPVSLI